MEKKWVEKKMFDLHGIQVKIASKFNEDKEAVKPYCLSSSLYSLKVAFLKLPEWI